MYDGARYLDTLPITWPRRLPKKPVKEDAELLQTDHISQHGIANAPNDMANAVSETRGDKGTVQYSTVQYSTIIVQAPRSQAFRRGAHGELAFHVPVEI